MMIYTHSKTFDHVRQLLYMIGYAVVLVVVSLMFDKSFYISNDYYGFYEFRENIKPEDSLESISEKVAQNFNDANFKRARS